MLWIYDDAITEDLADCIDPSGGMNSTVKMMGEEGMMGVYAQLQEDRINFPAIFLARHSDTPLDQSRYNFTRMHKGVPAVYDPERNDIYLEKSVPIQLKYDLHMLTTNVADLDELSRELLFRYSAMYYLTAQVPYESKRKIRFGIAINPDTTIRRASGVTEYVQTGKLFEAVLELECQGAVLLSYTPRHMQRTVVNEISMRSGIETLNNQ